MPTDELASDLNDSSVPFVSVITRGAFENCRDMSSTSFYVPGRFLTPYLLSSAENARDVDAG